MNDLPKENADDRYLKILKASSSLVPVAGGILSEVIEAAIRPRLTTGMDLWMKGVSDRLTDIEKILKVNIIESLASNDEFSSILIEAAQRAVRTHKENRRKYLQNIVVNSISQQINYDESMLFISYLDQFSEYHIQMLKMLEENREFVENGAGNKYDIRQMDAIITPHNHSISYSIRTQLTGLVFVDSTTIENVGYPYLSPHGKKMFDFVMKETLSNNV